MTGLTEKNGLVRIRGKSQPLYQQIGEHLREQIESEVLRPGRRLPTISALVKQWQVDYRTVRSALELLDREGLIRYRPRRGATVRGAPGRRSSMLFVRWSADPFCVAIAEGIRRLLKQRGRDAVIVDARQNHENFIHAIVNPGKGVKGLIVMPFDAPPYEQALREAVEAGLKVVFVDRILSALDLSAVTADHFAGAYRATRHLLERHDRPVYYVGHTTSPSSCREWFKGWSAAMHEYNVHELDAYTWELPIPEIEASTDRKYGWQNSHEAARKLFQTAKEDRYCIFAGNDYVAKGIYMAAGDAGLRVGEDIYMVGFGNLPLCEKLSPRLSSVSQPCEQIGYEAARLLHEALTDANPGPVHRVLPVELHVRESSTGEKK